MNNIQKRFLLFLIGCIGTRSLLVYLAASARKQMLFYMGILAIAPAIGFLYFYISGSRTTGPEVLGDKIWWDDARPFHSIMYLLFAYNAIIGNPRAWIYLLIDVVFGFVGFMTFHVYSGHFVQLLR